MIVWRLSGFLEDRTFFATCEAADAQSPDKSDQDGYDGEIEGGLIEPLLLGFGEIPPVGAKCDAECTDEQGGA